VIEGEGGGDLSLPSLSGRPRFSPGFAGPPRRACGLPAKRFVLGFFIYVQNPGSCHRLIGQVMGQIAPFSNGGVHWMHLESRSAPLSPFLSTSPPPALLPPCLPSSNPVAIVRYGTRPPPPLFISIRASHQLATATRQPVRQHLVEQRPNK